MARRVSQTDRDAVALLDRCEKGDREAIYDLTQIIRPKNVTELVDFVSPECPPRPEIFNALADVYDAYAYREA